MEITDDEGRASAPGEIGRLLITMLDNVAMALLRYDSGDMARAVDGPCPCERTLPTFGQIVGRRVCRGRVPATAMRLIDELLGAMERLEAPLWDNVRDYQVHHSGDGDFEVRVVAAGPLNPGLEPHLQTVLERATSGLSLPGDPQLRLTIVPPLSRHGEGKVFRFTSDLMAGPAAE